MQKKFTSINDAESTGETKFAPISVVDFYPESDNNSQSSWFIGGLDNSGSAKTSPATTPKSRKTNNLVSTEVSRASAPPSLLWDSDVTLKHNLHSFDLGFSFASEESQLVSFAGVPTPNVSSDNLTRTPSEELIHVNRLPSKPIEVNPTKSTRAPRLKRRF